MYICIDVLHAASVLQAENCTIGITLLTVQLKSNLPDYINSRYLLGGMSVLCESGKSRLVHKCEFVWLLQLPLVRWLLMSTC